MNELDDLLSWDVKLTLALAGLALAALVLWVLVPPLVNFVQMGMRRDRIFKDKRYVQNYRVIR